MCTFPLRNIWLEQHIRSLLIYSIRPNLIDYWSVTIRLRRDFYRIHPDQKVFLLSKFRKLHKKAIYRFFSSTDSAPTIFELFWNSDFNHLFPIWWRSRQWFKLLIVNSNLGGFAVLDSRYFNSSLMTLTGYVFFFQGNFQRSNINNEEIQFGRKFQTDWLRTSRYKPSFSFPFKRLSAQSISKWKNWIGSHSPNLNAILPVSQKSFRKIKKITLPRIELHFRLSIQLFVH